MAASVATVANTARDLEALRNLVRQTGRGGNLAEAAQDIDRALAAAQQGQGRFKGDTAELEKLAQQILNPLREAELELAKRKNARSQLDGLVQAAQSVKGVSVLSKKVDGLDASMLRELAETAGAKMGSGVVVLGLASNGKASLVSVVPVSCSCAMAGTTASGL